MNVAGRSICLALAVAATVALGSPGWRPAPADAGVNGPARPSVGTDVRNSDERQRCPGQRFAVETVPDGLSPYISLTAGEATGAFLLDYGATASTLSLDAAPGKAADGRPVAVSNFSLPTFPRARFTRARYWNARIPEGGQLGVVATDFLSLLTADFAYAGERKRVVLGKARCRPETLRARGLIPIRQSGYFSSDPGHVGEGRPNVPVVFLDIAGVKVPAQIDTGYDDIERRPSIDINAALFNRLIGEGVRLREQDSIGVMTCAGAETRSVYQLSAVTLLDDRGNRIRELGTTNLVRKAGNACGGIAGQREPAAQITASLLAGLGEIVFDPRNDTVWVPARR